VRDATRQSLVASFQLASLNLRGPRSLKSRDHAQKQAISAADEPDLAGKLGKEASLGADRAAARAFYEKDIELRQARLRADPYNAEMNRALCNSYDKVEMLATKSDHPPAARESDEKCLNLIKETLATVPWDAEHKIRVFRWLGERAQAKGDWAAARASYESYVVLYKDLLKSESPILRGLESSQLWVIYRNLGDVMQSSGDVIAARSYFELALGIVESSIVRGTFQGPRHMAAFAMDHIKLARIALTTNDPNALRVHRDAARAILNALDTNVDGVARARAALDELDK
jgi:tetratricopeptide (TPR) repeat protein